MTDTSGTSIPPEGFKGIPVGRRRTPSPPDAGTGPGVRPSDLPGRMKANEPVPADRVQTLFSTDPDNNL